MLLGKGDARLTKQPSSRQSISPGAVLDTSAQHPCACSTSSPALTTLALCVPEGCVLTQCKKQQAPGSAEPIALQVVRGGNERSLLQGRCSRSPKDVGRVRGVRTSQRAAVW